MSEEAKVSWPENAFWNMDYHLAGMIAEGVNQFLLAQRNGVPSRFSELGPEEAETAWETDLIDIRDGFRLIQKKSNGETLSSYEEADIRQALQLFAKSFQDLWD
jgi:hypothetical protein